MVHPCQRQLEMIIQAFSFPSLFIDRNAGEAVYGGKLPLAITPSMVENHDKSSREMVISRLSNSLAKIKMFLEAPLDWPVLSWVFFVILS
jgi:hypothetical protein